MKASLRICMETVLCLHSILLISLSEATIHDLLKSKGLPGGLFPTGVKSYSVDKHGQLSVRYEEPCLTTFEGEVRFDRVVKGNLTDCGLVSVEGMSQRELFLWFNVSDITVDDPYSGVILFNIGVAQKHLSFSLFEDPPVCCPQNEGSEMWKVSGRNDMGFGDGR